LNEVIRDGSHRIRLNMSAVSYLSSAGIRVLVTFYKKLGEIGGSFAIIDPSDSVRKILDLTRLTTMLLGGTLPESLTEPEAQAVQRIARENAVYEIVDRAIEAFECRVIGDPSLLAHGGYGKDNARMTTFDRDAAGLGLAAFGSGFDDCRDRYGEFLAVAGS